MTPEKAIQVLRYEKGHIKWNARHGLIFSAEYVQALETVEAVLRQTKPVAPCDTFRIQRIADLQAENNELRAKNEAIAKQYAIALDKIELLNAESRIRPCKACGMEEQRNAHGRIFYKELPHCSDQLTTLDDIHVQIAYDDKSGWVLHLEDDNGDKMFDIKISHCPKCGQPLPTAPEQKGGAE